MQPEKIGLVLEGGASRSYFSAGVMDALMDAGIQADYIIGASAGISNGVSYASGQRGRNIRMGSKYLPDKRYMGMRHLINPKNRSYYNIRFVFEEIPNKLDLFDYDAFAEYPGEVEACVTNVDSGKVEYLTLPRDDRTWRILVATCGLPILFQPTVIDGKRYMDGGITDPIPFKRALDSGCTKVIVVTTREDSYVKSEEKALKLAELIYRKDKAFAKALISRTAVYNQSRGELAKAVKNGSVFVISPKDTRDWHRTERAAQKLRQMYDAGLTAANELMPELKKYLESV